MPLPVEKTAWPPTEHANRYRQMELGRIWYSGKPEELAGAYQGGSSINTTNSSIESGARPQGTYITGGRDEFWGGGSPDDVDVRRHYPIAEDIARTTSHLFAGERVRYIVDGPVHEDDGEPTGAKDDDGEPILTWRKGDPMPETAAAQTRLDELLQACNFESVLLAASEVGVPLGSYALRIAIDKAVLPDRPTITRVDATATIPTYTWGMLTAVTFWRVVLRDGGTVWRHLECHEAGTGTVTHGLYKGTQDNLGEMRSLGENESTAPLLVAESATPGVIQMAPAGTTTAVSIPYALPDATDLANLAGRPAFTPAVRDLMGAADQFYSQMMAALDDGQSRLIIADYLLETAGKGRQLTFDRDKRLFRRVNLPPAQDETGKLPIEQVQFDLKVAEHLLGFEAMREGAIRAAGLNPQMMGDEGELVQQTATEYAGKNKRSMATRDAMIRYAKPELQKLLTGLLAVDVAEFKPNVKGVLVQPYPVRVEFPEAVQPTLNELVATARQLKDSGASTEEVVRATYPDADETQVRKIAAKRKSETQAVDPVTFGMGGAGIEPGMGV